MANEIILADPEGPQRLAEEDRFSGWRPTSEFFYQSRGIDFGFTSVNRLRVLGAKFESNKLPGHMHRYVSALLEEGQDPSEVIPRLTLVTRLQTGLDFNFEGGVSATEDKMRGRNLNLPSDARGAKIETKGGKTKRITVVTPRTFEWDSGRFAPPPDFFADWLEVNHLGAELGLGSELRARILGVRREIHDPQTGKVLVASEGGLVDIHGWGSIEGGFNTSRFSVVGTSMNMDFPARYGLVLNGAEGQMVGLDFFTPPNTPVEISAGALDLKLAAQAGLKGVVGGLWTASGDFQGLIGWDLRTDAHARVFSSKVDLTTRGGGAISLLGYDGLTLRVELDEDRMQVVPGKSSVLSSLPPPIRNIFGGFSGPRERVLHRS